jgi:rhodanese-related sulfurtransferase
LRFEHVEHVGFVEVRAAADRDRTRQREAVHEYAQSTHERAFAIVEQVVAPVDERTQRLLAREHIAPAPGEHAKAFVQPLAQLLRAQNLDPGGGQFDCQRNPVEAPADLGDDRRIIVAQHKANIDGLRAVDEELNRARRGCLGGGNPSGRVG